MNLSRILWVASVLALGAPTATRAQDPSSNFGTAGVREPASFVGEEDPVTRAAVAPTRPTLLIIPSFSSANGSSTVAGTVGVKLPNFVFGQPLQLRAGYRNTDLDADATRERFSGDAKTNLLARTTTTIAVGADIARTVEASWRYGTSVALEQHLSASKSWTVGLTAAYAWADPDTGDGTSDFIPAVGLSFTVPEGGPVLTGDYRLENDVDGEDSFSLTVRQAIPVVSFGAPTLYLIAAKHRALTATLSWQIVP